MGVFVNVVGINAVLETASIKFHRSLEMLLQSRFFCAGHFPAFVVDSELGGQS